MPATLVAAAEPLNGPPRVRLDVTLPGGSTSGSVLITRTDPTGHTQVVRLADPAAMTGTAWVGYDYEMPYGASVTYTAVVTYLNPGTIVDTLAQAVTLAVTDVWLIHPGIPDLSMLLAKVTNLADEVRAVKRGVFEAYGREHPLVVTDGKRKAAQSALTVRTRTLDEFAALNALCSDATVLLLNVPVSLGWGISNEYVSLGDLVAGREVQTGDDPYRLHTAPYLVVSRPVGGSQSQRTFADVLAEAPTFQDVLDQHTTFLELLAPTA